MSARKRDGFTLVTLLVVIAILAILLGLLLPAVAKVRMAASRTGSANNMKQIMLALHNYHDVNGSFPAGVDETGYSAFVRLLPYVEQDNLFKQIDLTKPLKDVPEKIRATRVNVFESPSDPLPPPTAFGPTNYLFVAGSKPALDDNNGLFHTDSHTRITEITDGTSNTIALVETLRGDGGKKAVDVRRQHVLLKADDLKDIKDEAGVDEFEKGLHIAGNRCASWMDGRFLQGTFTATRVANDPKPDVDCGGKGGLSGARSLNTAFNVGFADGSVRSIKPDTELAIWKALATRGGGEVINPENF